MPGIIADPKLNQILSFDKLPEIIDTLDTAIENLIDDIHYKNYRAHISRFGEAAHYNLTLVTYSSISFDIPGTGGVKLLLNPGIDNQPTVEIPIALAYRVEIIKFIRGLSIDNIGQDPFQFLSIILEMFNIPPLRFTTDIIEAFVGGLDPQQQFIDDFNAKHPGAGLSVGTYPNEEPLVDILLQIEDAGFDQFQVLYDDYLSGDGFDDTIARIRQVFEKYFGAIEFDDLLDLFIPRIYLAIESIELAIEFPRTFLTPIDTVVGSPTFDEPLPDPAKSRLTFDVGRLIFDNATGLEFEGETNLTFPKSQIGQTDFRLSFSDMKLDLSTTKNIQEATAAGYDNDFVGVFIGLGEIEFPAFWNHDDPNSTGVIIGRELLVGTGGISGTIGLEAKTEGNPAPLICARFGQGFELCLTSFALTFQQNAIIESNIQGTMKIPKFKDANGNDAELLISINIGQDGDFSVTALEPDGIEIKIPNVLQIFITSATIGREDDRFFLTLSGSLQIDPANPTLSQLLPTPVEFQKLTIWDDGEFEIEGGGIQLPQALSLKFPPVDLSITAIHLGSAEREYDNAGTLVLRKYKYIGFDGGVKVDPGGVDARGKGIQVYFSSDNSVLPLDVFIRIESIAIDIIIPGNKSAEEAALLISGYLSMKEPPPGIPGTEYAGGIDFSLPKLEMAGSARMRYNPKVPYFLTDIGLEMSTPILLGPTGLGIYGFRALVGKNFVATKASAGVPDEGEWWQYYKVKQAEDYQEGIQISKFEPTEGFSLGAGVSLATAADSGQAFGSKVFFLLSLPEIFLIQGQAQINKGRIPLISEVDPPFFVLIAISPESVEAAFGVNYLIPDDKDAGSIARVQGVAELGFFFGDSSAWYVNIGRDLPEDRRILVRLVELFDAYFYFMLSNSGIKAGAGASFEANIKAGPLKAFLCAYLDVAGRISFSPKQIGGSIQLGGGVDISIFGLGFAISAAASLAAESPEPFIITGGVEVCIRILGKDRCAKFEFTWEFNDNVDTTEIEVISLADLQSGAKALNIQTRENFNLNYVTTTSLTGLPPAPTDGNWSASFDEFIIPMDCFIDIEFKKGMNPIGSGQSGNASLDNFGRNGGANYYEYVAPQKGKTPRVLHKFIAEEIEIYSWNPVFDNGDGTFGKWETYDMYEALTPLDDLPFIDPVAIDALDLKFGYWQLDDVGKYNKLRILSQNPLSYVTQGTGNIVIEDLGVDEESIFCDEDPIEKCCINFENYLTETQAALQHQIETFGMIAFGQPQAPIPSGQQAFVNLTEFAAGQLHHYQKFSFTITGTDGQLVEADPFQGLETALAIRDEDCLEIVFQEPMACIDLTLQTSAVDITVEFYQLQLNDPQAGPGFSTNLIDTQTYTQATLNAGPVQWTTPGAPADRIIIKAGICAEGTAIPDRCDPEITAEASQLQVFLNALLTNGHFLKTQQAIYPDDFGLYDGIYYNSILYQFPGGIPTPISYNQLFISDTTLIVSVTTGEKEQCVMRFIASGTIDWSLVTSFTNLRQDPNNIAVGTNFNGLIDANLSDGTVVTVSIQNNCWNIINCYGECTSFLYEICFLTEAEFAYNETIVSSAAAETQAMIDALEQTFQPIWRPNTTYAIKIRTQDDVSGGGTNNHSNTFYYGFKTTGPLGHYHRYLDDNNSEVVRTDYQELEQKDREDSYKLSTLQHYIDFKRSYPNADGELINAKPLYYVSPTLLLFYKNQYVYSMFGDWDVYNGNEKVESVLNAVIQDPVETNVPPSSNLSWQQNQFPPLGADVLLLNNFIENATTGCPPQNPITPSGVNTQVEIDELKPLKLYTAIYQAVYKNGETSGLEVTREVHRHGFQTSRYADFAEHIYSYQLLVDNSPGGAGVIKTAVFDESYDIKPAQFNLAQSILAGNNDLITDYAEVYERLLQGALELGTEHPAISTEFNIIRNLNDGNVVGILVRSPEPFNDPKTPSAVLDDTLLMQLDTGGGYGQPTDFKVIFSKDNANAFITNADNSMQISPGTLKFTFKYKLFDGNSYVDITLIDDIEITLT